MHNFLEKITEICRVVYKTVGERLNLTRGGKHRRSEFFRQRERRDRTYQRGKFSNGERAVLTGRRNILKLWDQEI